MSSADRQMLLGKHKDQCYCGKTWISSFQQEILGVSSDDMDIILIKKCDQECVTGKTKCLCVNP